MSIKDKNFIKGQVVLEFTFCFIILLLLFYGCLMAFRWSGLSLADRRVSHDDTSTGNINEHWGYSSYESGPLNQLQPNFYKMMPMNLVFNNW